MGGSRGCPSMGGVAEGPGGMGVWGLLPEMVIGERHAIPFVMLSGSLGDWVICDLDL